VALLSLLFLEKQGGKKDVQMSINNKLFLTYYSYTTEDLQTNMFDLFFSILLILFFFSKQKHHQSEGLPPVIHLTKPLISLPEHATLTSSHQVRDITSEDCISSLVFNWAIIISCKSIPNYNCICSPIANSNAKSTTFCDTVALDNDAFTD